MSTITNFKNNDIYVTPIDEFGNLSISAITDRNIAYKMSEFNFDDSKIESLFDVKITTFVSNESTSPVDLASVELLKQNNDILQEELNKLLETRQSDQKKTNELDANVMASKQIILALRKKLKQGENDEDFSEVFPYLPLK